MSPKVQLLVKQPAAVDDDALVVVLESGWETSEALLALQSAMGGGLVEHLKRTEFDAAKGVINEIPTLGRAPFARLIVVGRRDENGGDGARHSVESRLAEAVSAGVRTSLAGRPRSVAVAANKATLRSIALGAALGAYTFDKYTSDVPRRPSTVSLLLDEAPSLAEKKEFSIGLGLAEGVCLARDLVNEPPNVLTPKEFAQRARHVAKKNGLTCKILDHDGIKNAGMHLHDAVGKGSDNLPYFIHLTYKPRKATGKIVFVGKGLTFDSGGLCIKPGPSMPDMKSDMSGGAAVLGLMDALSALAPEVEVHGIIGAAENMPDAKAYRPSDVISSLSGKGVEIINTDAEGRLVLADALTYATRLAPDLIVDAATLTGATLISLGTPYSAYFTNRDEIARAMDQSAAAAGESFWRMPLIEELAAQLKSNVTDLKHTGERWGGAITAALFLREFIDGVPWMHCDIPGAVYRDRAVGIHPLGGTGHGVLTFLNLALHHAENPIVPPVLKTSSKAQASGTRKGVAPARAKEPNRTARKAPSKKRASKAKPKTTS